MPLLPMAPGGRWVRPPNDAPPVYVPAKQTEAHLKRLFADGWVPIDDPRTEEQQSMAQAHAEVRAASNEVAMQARIDQLEAMVMQLLAQKSEQQNASTDNASSTDSQSADVDKRSRQRKPAI